jgi:hypothetical protein
MVFVGGRLPTILCELNGLDATHFRAQEYSLIRRPSLEEHNYLWALYKHPANENPLFHFG